MASRTDESAELRRQLDVADANIALVNKRLDEAQGMFKRHPVIGARCSGLIYMLYVDGAAAVENLRAELARAKEQARKSDAAAVKAAEELKAEQAAHCQSKKEIAEMAKKLKDATDRCKFLEQEDRAAQKDLEKITAEAKDTRSAMRAMKEELRQAGDITTGKPYMLRMKFGDPKYAPLDR